MKAGIHPPALAPHRLGWVVALLVLGSVAGFGQVIWDNGAGTGAWNTGTNWSTNTVPNSASNVQFNATDTDATVTNITLGGNRFANSLTFNNVDDNFSILNGSGTRTLTLTSGDITRTAGSSGTQTLAFSNLGLGGDSLMDINGSGQLTISARITGTGRSLTKTGTGILQLSGSNTFSGGTTLSAGSLYLGHNSALGTGTFTIGGGTVAAVTAARTITNSVSITNDFTIGGSQDLTFSGGINLGGGTRTITVDNTATTTFSGVVSEPWYSGFTKEGAGNLVLSGSNTFTAPVAVNAGTLTLANNNALGTSTWGNTVADGATLALTNNITVTEGQFSITGTGVSGAGALRNVTGTNTLAAAVNLGGDTTFNAVAGTLSVSGQIDLGAGNTLTTAGGGNTTLSGVITNTGGITKTGSGVLTLSGSGANSFTGTLAVNDGTVALAKAAGTNAVASAAVNVGDGSGAAGSAVLRLDASNQIADYTGLITINSDGVLQVNNFTESIDTISGTGLIDLSTSGYLTVGVNSGSSTFGGTIAGTGTLEKAGSGTLTFTSNIDFGGTLTLSGGTLALSDISLTAGTLLVTGNSIIDFGGASTLDVNLLTISDGVTLTIQNWAGAADFFYTQNWTGAVLDTTGVAPMNQVTFTGFTADKTAWSSYDRQIAPVPEPSTYGAILLAIAGGLLGWRRWRRSS
jgi:fibronectin-binding autotransporter adhesin